MYLPFYLLAMCYGCLPLVYNQLMETEGERASIIVVVTPLTAIMKLYSDVIFCPTTSFFYVMYSRE